MQWLKSFQVIVNQGLVAFHFGKAANSRACGRRRRKLANSWEPRMNPPDREITEEEWIAASQACCGSEPDDEADEVRKTEGGDRPPPPSSDLHAPPTDR
jgi:hypothetical protein